MRGLPRVLWRNRKQTPATRDEWISLWNSKHEPISGRTDLEATGAYSFINLERKSMHAVHMEVFPPPPTPEPGPHGSVIIQRPPDKLRTGCGSRGSFFRRRYLIEGGGTRHYLKSPGAHGGNYVKSVLFGYTPTVEMKSQKSSWQPPLSPLPSLCLCSPAIRPGRAAAHRPPVCSALILIIISFSAALPSL